MTLRLMTQAEEFQAEEFQIAHRHFHGTSHRTDAVHDVKTTKEYVAAKNKIAAFSIPFPGCRCRRDTAEQRKKGCNCKQDLLNSARKEYAWATFGHDQ